jgi:2-oxoglutarate ferredoxin oxidoreductase subunit beta
MTNDISALIQQSNLLTKYDSKNKHTWCSGCGDYGILSAIKRALTLENIQPHNAVMCFDVGCNGNASDKVNTNTIHGLHGRSTILASGIANANPKLQVIATGGDGSTFSEGINHLIHCIRNNYNITFICHNNANYGLTIGQASSITPAGQNMNALPGETVAEPLNTLDLVLSCKPTFVARGFSGNITQMTDIIRKGMQNQGFSYVEMLQVCPTFNKFTPQEWYWDKIYDLKEANHDTSDIWSARKIALDTDKLGLGVIYENPRESFLETQKYRNPKSSLVEEVKNYEISELLEEFM